MPPICRLAPLASTDQESLLRLYTDPGVREFLGGAVSVIEARRRVTSLFERHDSGSTWAIRINDRNSEVFIGIVSLDAHQSGQDMQVSYLLLPEHQGRGYASRAVADALEHAFTVLGLARVVAETQAKNIRSIRLLERLGMRFERKIIRFGAEQCIYAIHPSPAA